MNIQVVKLSSFSQERSLRQDFDYQLYHTKHSENYYKFEELFELVDDDTVSLDSLYQPFLYCEIGNADKNGDVIPVKLDFSERNLLDENYYKKIEKGDIISAIEGDILISKVRPNLKKYVRITDDLVGTYFTSAFIHIRAKCIPEILFYCFRNMFFNDLMAISRQGKGYPTLSETDLLALRFDKSIIDRLLQSKDLIIKEIVNIENEISALKRLFRSQQDIIDSVFQREFKFDYKMFYEKKLICHHNTQLRCFADNPDFRFSAKFHRQAGLFIMSQLTELTDKKIKHFISEPIVLGASVSPGDYSDEGDCCYISMATIKSWTFEPESANTVSKAYSDLKTDKTVQKNDIILARSGEGTIGKVALIEDENIQGVFADFTMRIRLKDYNPEFAYYYFRTSYFQYLIEVFKKGLGNNTNIFPVVIQEFPMIDISLDEQQRIVDEIHSEIDKQNKLKARIASLREEIDKIIEDTALGSKATNE